MIADAESTVRRASPSRRRRQHPSARSWDLRISSTATVPAASISVAATGAPTAIAAVTFAAGRPPEWPWVGANHCRSMPQSSTSEKRQPFVSRVEQSSSIQYWYIAQLTPHQPPRPEFIFAIDLPQTSDAASTSSSASNSGSISKPGATLFPSLPAPPTEATTKPLSGAITLPSRTVGLLQTSTLGTTPPPGHCVALHRTAPPIEPSISLPTSSPSRPPNIQSRRQAAGVETLYISSLLAAKKQSDFSVPTVVSALKEAAGAPSSISERMSEEYVGAEPYDPDGNGLGGDQENTLEEEWDSGQSPAHRAEYLGEDNVGILQDKGEYRSEEEEAAHLTDEEKKEDASGA